MGWPRKAESQKHHSGGISIETSKNILKEQELEAVSGGFQRLVDEGPKTNPGNRHPSETDEVGASLGGER